MTVRVALAVLLAVGIVAAAAPGIQAARERASVDAVETDAVGLAAAIRTVADAPTGTRRVVTVTVPGSTVATAGVATVTVRSRSVRYRLDSGRRGALALPEAVEPTPRSNQADASAVAGGLRLAATGTHELVVIATTDGVRVTRATALVDPVREPVRLEKSLVVPDFVLGHARVYPTRGGQRRHARSRFGLWMRAFGQ